MVYLAAASFYGMVQSHAPFRLRMILASIRPDAELAIRGWCELETGRVFAGMHVTGEVVFSSFIEMGFEMEISIQQIEPDSQAHVTIFGENTPLELITALRPDVLVKGGDWSLESIVGADVVRSRGGKVKALPYSRGYSTTGLVRRFRR